MARIITLLKFDNSSDVRLFISKHWKRMLEQELLPSDSVLVFIQVVQVCWPLDEQMRMAAVTRITANQLIFDI